MTIKQELAKEKLYSVGLEREIEYLQERLELVAEQRDSYAKALQEVCMNLSKRA